MGSSGRPTLSGGTRQERAGVGVTPVEKLPHREVVGVGGAGAGQIAVAVEDEGAIARRSVAGNGIGATPGDQARLDVLAKGILIEAGLRKALAEQGPVAEAGKRIVQRLVEECGFRALAV